ncbi:MAG: methyltransferase domain-containing protein [Planctomycetes bacterium]|jgi:16S rRNA (guanine527-N7)-methyltransferase|nr:16S rRNA (guanine(527)-N(7))-methyltransferase RsmG [Phycisphaerae bacterium]NBB96185.1 methyltransferase domain-containing protein [Planctomycetota bacterium]
MPPAENILRFLRDCGLDPGRSPLATMQSLYARLVEANRQFNLTRITDEWDYWRLHVADSLAVGQVCPELLAAPLRVADVGCGAGFPLLPLAWANPAGEFVGVEATGKKAAFIVDTIEALGLANATVYYSQAREAGRADGLAGTFDVVVFRAVGQAGEVLKDVRGLLKPTGRVIAWKAPPAVAEERELTAREVGKFGFAVTESPVVALPDGSEQRQFVIFQKQA